MEETRKIGDYSVKYSMYIGHKDIALGENPGADKDERYMCCFVETNAIFERYSGVLVSDDFAEIAKAFWTAESWQKTLSITGLSTSSSPNTSLAS